MNYSNSTIAGRYRTGVEVGKGAFARVYRAVDTTTNTPCALKILKREYARDAQREVEVLSAINKKDSQQVQRVCRMLNQFTFEGQPVIIFNLCGPALRSRKFGTGDMAELARVAKQLSGALHYLHYHCRVVHTDLKPENILLESPNPSMSGLGSGWKICDLGSASFYTERPDKELITTRPYRAPEVILQNGWCYPADMFSLGIILFEIHTGRTVFECTRYCDSDAQHLEQMDRRLGKFPAWMVNTASSKARASFFDINGSLKRVSHFGGSGTQPVAVGDAELQDLVHRLIHYDPVVRMRADEVGHHPFVTRYTGSPDHAVVAEMPRNAYTAGYITTPGCTKMRAGARHPANKLLPKEAPANDYRAAAAVRPPASAGGLGLPRTDHIRGRTGLSDLTNRPAAGLPSGMKRHLQPLQQARPMHRTGSATAGMLNRGAGLAGMPLAGVHAHDDFWCQREVARARAHEAWLYR